MRDFIKRYWKFLILALSIFIFAIVTHKLLNQELTDGFDTHIHDFVISFETPILTFFFKFVTFLSSAPFLIILSFLLFFIFKNKKYGLLSLINLVAIVTVNQILKYAFSRPRPLEWMLIEESGFSFPSGHAMVSAAFYGMLIYLIWQTKVSKRQKKIWTIVLAILVFLIGLSRIYLGVHYASDIIAGFTLSLSYLMIATSVISYYLKYKRQNQNKTE